MGGRRRRRDNRRKMDKTKGNYTWSLGEGRGDYKEERNRT